MRLCSEGTASTPSIRNACRTRRDIRASTAAGCATPVRLDWAHPPRGAHGRTVRVVPVADVPLSAVLPNSVATALGAAVPREGYAPYQPAMLGSTATCTCLLATMFEKEAEPAPAACVAAAVAELDGPMQEGVCLTPYLRPPACNTTRRMVTILRLGWVQCAPRRLWPHGGRLGQRRRAGGSFAVRRTRGHVIVEQLVLSPECTCLNQQLDGP
jgi:hypothetical protein